MKVVLNAQFSRSSCIDVSVPQRSLLGHTLFLIFINPLPDDISSKLDNYADGATIYTCLNSK